MCPECIPTFSLMVAGASSLASVSLLFLRNLVRAFPKPFQSAAKEKSSS
jgi:hypothetical protein